LRRIAQFLLVPTALFALALPVSAVAGGATPVTVAQGKRAAKHYAHQICNQKAATCRGVRVKDCGSINKFRVDCLGYLLFANQYCTFKIKVIAQPNQTLSLTALGRHCHPYNNG
jgi:hypothetical protein